MHLSIPGKDLKPDKTITRSVNNMVVVENSLVSLGFSKNNGSIIHIKDLKRDITYVDGFGETPFRMEIDKGLECSFQSFTYNRDQHYSIGQAYELTWEIGHDIRLMSRIELEDDSDQIRFTSRVENRSDKSVLAVEYPVLGGIKEIDKGNDYLVHPYATGILIKDPIKNFSKNGDGLRFMPYPESFSGASMQFMSYYSQSRGGIYCGAYDGEYRQKWLNAYKMNGKLELSLMYGYEDIGVGKDLNADFPFILKMNKGDGWYESAEIYKEWAIEQIWCKKGPLSKLDSDEKASWLLEEVGLATFGINGMHDRTKWIERYHDRIKTPIFHILGPDWVKTVQNFYSGVPGGLEDWLPTRFSKENLDLIRENGDRFAPFEFDFLVDTNKSDGENLRRNLQLFPANPKSHDGYDFNMLCPYTEYTQNLHVKRDVEIYKEAKVDSMYYDISANNLIKTCMSSEHGHPVGGGKAITDGYREIYKRTKDEISLHANRYIPLGTEMMNEVFLDVIDYYQARAWAQPSSALETWPLRSLMISGNAEMIPLFTYVYHEYGAVRLDGWGKLVKEIGDLYYHNVAKTYLWGGIYEINHEYSPMETIDGVENSPKEHYYRFKPKGYEFDEERAGYLSQYAHLRTGYGNKYLAYGIMQRPLIFNNPLVQMEWFHYNHDNEEKGKIDVPSIINSVWKHKDDFGESLAFFFANTTDSSLDIDVNLDISEYGLDGIHELRLISRFDVENVVKIDKLGGIDSKIVKELSLKLDPKQVYMVEILK